MILLNELLKFTPAQEEIAKVKFNIFNGSENPIDIYKRDPDRINKRWLYWRNKKRYFSVGQIAICLVKIREDYWLLTTVDTVDSELNITDGINYTGKPFNEYQGYYGRTIVKFHKNFQTQGVNYTKVKDQLEVCQILPDTFDDDDFLGYDKVKLSYSQLKSILDRNKKDWIAALGNQKAVYLITDLSNGKLYVGSATSDNRMLLQRWKNYVANGHGGNKELKAIVDTNGIKYVEDYFQYSILENYNSKIDDDVILARESWWKEILQTRKYGYNDN